MQQKHTLSRRRRAMFTAAVAVAASATGLAAARNAEAATETWNTTSSGAWNNTANWNPTTAFPNNPGDVADISTKDIGGNVTISLNQPITVGGIKIGDQNNTNAYTIAAGTGGYLVFDGNGASAFLNHVSPGNNDVISAPVYLNSSLQATNATSTSMTLSGLVSSSAGAEFAGGNLL